MASYRRAQVSALLTALGLPVVAMAGPLSLSLTDDAWVNANDPANRYSATSALAVHAWGPKDGLLKFDNTALAGASINSATLTFYLREIAVCGSVVVYPIASNWVEETVTWNARPTIAATPAASVAVCPQDIGEVQVDLTSLVQSWADGSVANYGVLLRAQGQINARIDSKEQSGGVPARLSAEIGDREIVLDLSDPENCTIDSPGHYVLDRTWWFAPHNGSYSGEVEPNARCEPAQVRITGSGITLDLRGFSLQGGPSEYFPVLRIDTAAAVTIRDGRLVGVFVAIESSVASIRRVTLDGVNLGGAALLGNRPVTMMGGSASGDWEAALQVGADSRVIGAALGCSESECLSARGSSLIRDCTLTLNASSGAPAIFVTGDDTIVEGNVLAASCSGCVPWLGISGNRNVVARNYSSTGYILVNGARNVLEGNIGPDIVFETAGNFYGNNRAALPGGFGGTAGNVDWGGNVTY